MPPRLPASAKAASWPAPIPGSVCAHSTLPVQGRKPRTSPVRGDVTGFLGTGRRSSPGPGDPGLAADSWRDVFTEGISVPVRFCATLRCSLGV
jgi:hypothetical protein